MEFGLDDEEKLIVKSISDFCDTEVEPWRRKLGDVLYDDRKLLSGPGGALHPDVLAAVEDIRLKSAKAGFYAMHMPPEVGGGGIGRVVLFHAWREVNRRGLGLTASVLGGVQGPTRMLLHLGEEQRRKYLHPLVSGEKTTCFCLTEPGAGSDVRNIATTAVKDGDGWVLNGTKTFVTNGPYADFLQVFAKTDPQAEGFEGISLFLVDRGAAGLQQGPVQQHIANDGLQCEFTLENVRVPAKNLVGEPGQGFYYAIENIDDTRVMIGGMCCGLARYCIDRAVEFTRERQVFGKPVSKFQGVSFNLADSEMELLAAELITQYASWKIERGENAIMESSMAKLYATEMLWRVSDRCIQAHGGVGVMREMELERILRFARASRIFEGTSEIQRWTITKMMGL